jgi:lycopene beta-cyclase
MTLTYIFTCRVFHMHMMHHSKSPREYDLIIIGGGCSGLSLAAALCRLAAKPEYVPLTLIIEPRSCYTNDRSWCYWEESDQADSDLITKSWSVWEYSSNSVRSRHSSKNGWKYHYVSAIRFYNHVEEKISENPNITLLKNSHVVDVCTVENKIEIILKRGKYGNNETTEKILTKQVVDTRFPQNFGDSVSTLNQVFFGFEVKTDKPHQFDDVALVMKDMRIDEEGFVFDYVLPLNSNDVLIELTRFTGSSKPPESLRSDALRLLRRVLGNSSYQIVREESGVIPMGLSHFVVSTDSRWIRTGLGAGAARPSTGYAFKRIQHWAQQCAEAILNGRQGLSFPPDNTLLSWMDKIFLNAIKGNPALAPQLFMSLAHNVPPERLLRFLTDRPETGDFLAVMLALPKRPLIRCALIELYLGILSACRNLI